MTMPVPESEREAAPHPAEPIAAEELWRRIAWCGTEYPTDALRQAAVRRDEIVPILLRAIEEVLADPRKFAEDPEFFGTIFAFLLLAQLRETRASPLAIRFLRLDHVLADNLVCDMVTEEFPAVLASTFDGDLDALKQLYEDEELDEFIRIAGLSAMGALVQHGLLPRQDLSVYLGEVMTRLRREPSWVWNRLVAVASDLQFTEHREAVLSLYDEGLADPMVDAREDVEARFDPGEQNRHPSEYRLIEDVVEETRGWACFRRGAAIQERNLSKPNPFTDEAPDDKVRVPFVREGPKVGRNEPCPCGSGRKFKKCCGA